MALEAPVVGAVATVVVGAVVLDADEPWLDELHAASNTPQATMKLDLTTIGALRFRPDVPLTDTHFLDQSLRKKVTVSPGVSCRQALRSRSAGTPGPCRPKSFHMQA